MTAIACASLIATTFTGSSPALSERTSSTADAVAAVGHARDSASVLGAPLAADEIASYVRSESAAAVSERGIARETGAVEVSRDTAPRSETACTYAQHRFLMDAVRWYQARVRHWTHKMGAGTSLAEGRIEAKAACPRFLARTLRARAHALRLRWERYRTLRDFEVRAGNRAWLRAVLQAQKPYPGTKAWLLSCSASEGGWGRWVPNSGDSGSGGWMQFMEPTFWRMWGAAKQDVRKRGFRVPSSAASWYSPLGQALAGAWGVTHGRSHEWFGSGC